MYRLFAILLWSLTLTACADAVGHCASDDQCGPNLICSESRCVAPCTSDAVCGEGALCVAGRCAVGCNDHEGCPLEKLCRDGLCVNGCDSNDRCASYQYCSDQGQCLDGCGRDGDCAAGQICEANKCVPILRADAGTRGCSGHEECRVGEFCDPDGLCRVGCRPGTCAARQRCDEASGQCVPRSGGADAGPVGGADAGPVGPNCWLSVGGEATEALPSLADGQLNAEGGRNVTWRLANPEADGPALTLDGDQIVGLRVGHYEVEGLVASGDAVQRCLVPFDVVAPRGYWLELAWDGDRDLDLHMVPVPNQQPCDSDRVCARNPLQRTQCNLGYCSRGFGSADARDGDCWARNRNPSWSDPNDRRSNPHYLVDARSGSGTEYIRVDAISRGWIYPIALRSWGEQTNIATLRVFRDGRLIGEQAEMRVGPDEEAPWLYVGRLTTEGYESVLRLSEQPPRD